MIDFTTAKIYRDDAKRLNSVRKALQADRRDDQTIADTVAYLLDQHEASEAWMRLHYGPATSSKPATMGEE